MDKDVINDEDSQLNKDHDLIHAIQETRNIIKKMNNRQKLKKAKAHIFDALQNQHPRPFSQNLQINKIFKIVYSIILSTLWRSSLHILSYIYMYLVILDHDKYQLKIGTESFILILFWIDTLLIFYTQSFDNFTKKYKYEPHLISRVVLLILLTIDLIIFISFSSYNEKPIRPFRIFRAFLPISFNSQIRKIFISLVSTYKDIIVFFIFFSLIIVSWAIVGVAVLKIDENFIDPNISINIDPYKSNYQNLSSMIFIMYVTGTYDSYPDSQMVAIQNFEGNYMFFIVFIFLNMFLYSSIPGSLIYRKFRETFSKLILLEQLKQQRSLILAYVTLTGHSKYLSMDKLVLFLWYLYRKKTRYAQYITDICLKLNAKNSKTIHVNQFMQISKIILQNSVYYPPRFDDVELWTKFRQYVNQKLYLKTIVKHYAWQLVISLLIILAFINAIFYIFKPYKIITIFDSILVIVFMLQIIIRIIGIGPQNFFIQRWNGIDAFLVCFGFIFWIFPISTHIQGVIRMSRIFKLSNSLRLVSYSNFIRSYKFEMIGHLIQIFSLILDILPIIYYFSFILLFFFYIFGILGMQIFYDFSSIDGSSNYNNYQQFSHFSKFLNSQYIMVQILTEAGWSQIAYDHSWKAPQYFGYIMLYFCSMHLTITYVIASLIKRIFWQTYFTVNQTFKVRQKQIKKQEVQYLQYKIKKKQKQEFRQQKNNKYIIYTKNKIFKERLFQDNIKDNQIFKMIYFRKKQQNIKSQFFINKTESRILFINNSKIKSLKQNIKFTQKNKIKATDNVQIKIYTYSMSKDSFFKQFLKQKLFQIRQYIKQQQFNLKQSPIYNRQSIRHHIFYLKTILNIETSKRMQKSKILNNLVQQNMIPAQNVDKLLKKRLSQKSFAINSKGILRSLFLSPLNEQLINKYQIEYFQNNFGQKYKQINRIKLQYLLKYEANLIYCLKNIIRYIEIQFNQFFKIFYHIQNKISNILLSRGSLFKFVYGINHYDKQLWFTIEYTCNNEVKIHFLKSQIWFNFKDFKDGEIFHAKDIFKYMPKDNHDQFFQYLKQFFKNFQSLGLTLQNKQTFLQFTPKQYIYDLFVQKFDVEETKRFKNRQIQISKIMLVILSRQQKRLDLKQQNLSYDLSDQSLKCKRKPKPLELLIQQKQIFQKLKNHSQYDFQKILQNQGLPFTYIINLIKQMQAIMTNYSQNLVFQVQKAIDYQYNSSIQYFLKNKN